MGVFETTWQERTAARVAIRYANSLEDVSKLRFQAVFMMGAGGSGKGYVGRKWMKYMPGGTPKKDDPWEYSDALAERKVDEQERSLSNISFEKALAALNSKGVRLEVIPGGSAKIPFLLYTYDDKGREHLVPQKDWKSRLPGEIFQQVQGLKEVVFAAPVYEIPSYWRQVDPDLYKKELAGYMETEPGYVHEMSSTMAKGYFESILETGDPLFVDGTGANLEKMATKMAKASAAGYRTSLIFVSVPLTVNQIRNATRSRIVGPLKVIEQWRDIGNNFADLRSQADKAKVIINRNDRSDIAKYKAHGPEIEALIRKTTSFDSLYDLIKANASSELKDWGKLLKQNEGGDNERERRFKRLEEKRRERGMSPREFLAAARKVLARLEREQPSREGIADELRVLAAQLRQ